MKKKQIAKYAAMASKEAHEEYMSLSTKDMTYYVRDIISEMIDKFDTIEAMARRPWYKRF